MSDNPANPLNQTIIVKKKESITFPTLHNLRDLPIVGNFQGLSRQHTHTALHDLRHIISTLQMIEADLTTQGDQGGVAQFAGDLDITEERIQRKHNVSKLFTEQQRIHWMRPKNADVFPLQYSHLETVSPRWIADVTTNAVRTDTQFHVRLLNVARDYRLGTNRFRDFVSIIRKIRVAILENPDDPAELSAKDQQWLKDNRLLAEAQNIAQGWFGESVRFDDRISVEIKSQKFEGEYGKIKLKRIGDIARVRATEMGVKDEDEVGVEVIITKISAAEIARQEEGDEGDDAD